MKATKLFIAVVAIFSANAHAIYRPGWERPVQEATMREYDGLGHEVGIGLDKKLVMNQMDGSNQAVTSFVFHEEKQVQCVTYPCNPIVVKTKFKVDPRQSGRDKCGSMRYVAYEVMVKRPGEIFMPAPVKSMILQDHTARLCDDYKPARWMMVLNEGVSKRFARHLRGNPTPVYTIQLH